MNLNSIDKKLSAHQAQAAAVLDEKYHRLFEHWPDSDLQLLADGDPGPRAAWLAELCNELESGAAVAGLRVRYRNESESH